jgi:gamma-D-glutamyl-L-lysine dipeptidyl-peptidase
METASVRVSVAPVLAARSLKSEQVTQALLGVPVRILERTSRWARIRMEDEYEGWIAASGLGADLPASSEWVSMSDLWVNLRTRPDYRMPARQTAFIGTKLPLRNREPGWLGVLLPTGHLGWLEEHRGTVSAPDARAPSPPPAEVLATARRFLGVPYLWGGCSPLGLDCSGFVQLVYRLHGARLPRDADQQAEVGLPVSAGDGRPAALAPGDAVFFCSESSRERITHVGLALGDGQFIHAAGGDGVRINRMADRPYAERLVAARRYASGSLASGG